MSSGPINRMCLLRIYRSCSHKKMGQISQNIMAVWSRGFHCMCRHTTLKITHRDRQCVSGLLQSWVTQKLSQQRGIVLRPANQPVINPIKGLQQFMAEPIIPPEEVLFDPSPEEIAKGENLFRPDRKHEIKFLKSAVFTEHLPNHDLPEVAFVGRSNVGKSSLIRAVLGAVDVDVRVSSKPGHTRTLNFFQVGKALSLVDMPGYGFNMPDHFTESVEVFLHSRRKLSRSFVLIDAGQGITKTDRIGLDMMEQFRIPYVIVMTKVDRAVQSKLLQNLHGVLKYRENTNFCFHQPFLTSAYTKDGISLLQTFIAYVTGNVGIEGL